MSWREIKFDCKIYWIREKGIQLVVKEARFIAIAAFLTVPLVHKY